MLISDARELRAMLPRRRLVPSPAQFAGPLDELWDRFIEPNLPASEAVADFHRGLVRFVQSSDPLLLVRYVRGMIRGQEYVTSDGTRLKATDNAPAWWVHYALVQDCRIAPDGFPRVIETMPAHLFEVSRTMPLSASSAGWHIAHLFAVKDRNTDFFAWRRPDAIGRFLRNVHPCNHGLVPKPEWQRWGGNERVLAFFMERLARRFAAVWDGFLDLARVDRDTIARLAGPVHYSYGGTTPVTATTPEVPQDARAAADSRRPAARASYRATRLLFRRDVIEPLSDDDAFEIVTPLGTFVMTKGDFRRAFANVRRSASYRERGVYHYPTVPRVALEFLVPSSDGPG